jgi:hypothetical protein
VNTYARISLNYWHSVTTRIAYGIFVCVALLGCNGGSSGKNDEGKKNQDPGSDPRNEPRESLVLVEMQRGSTLTVELHPEQLIGDDIEKWFVDHPQQGLATLLEGGSVEYTANDSYIGQEQFTVQFADAYANLWDCHVTIDILGDIEPFKETWRQGTFGDCPGISGIGVGDIDGDGKTEIVTSGSVLSAQSGTNWYVLRKNPSLPVYDVVEYHDAPTYITSLVLCKRPWQSGMYILMGDDRGYISVFDGRERRLLTKRFNGDSEILKMLIADADNDGTEDLVVMSWAGIRIIQIDTFEMGPLMEDFHTEFEVGNVDDEPGNEIVVSTGAILSVKDGVITVKREPDFSFGHPEITLMRSAEASHDTIIYPDFNGNIVGFDAVLNRAVWEYTPANIGTIGSMRSGDADMDGKPELIYSIYPGGTHGLDIDSFQETWDPVPDIEGATSYAVADSDDDSETELLFGNGWFTWHSLPFTVYDVRRHKTEWEGDVRINRVQALAVGDIDDDGRLEIAVGAECDRFGFEHGLVQVFDYQTKLLEWEFEVIGGFWGGIHDLTIGDVDSDGRTELIVASNGVEDGVITVIDGRTHSLVSTWIPEAGSLITAIRISQDSKGNPTVVIATGDIIIHDSSNKFMFVDVMKHEVLWSSDNLVANFAETNAMEITDVTGDGIDDVVAVRDKVWLIDGWTKTITSTELGGYSSLCVADFDGDGVAEIAAGANGGVVDLFDPSTMHLTKHVSVGTHGGPVCALAAIDVTGDDVADLISIERQQLDFHWPPSVLHIGRLNGATAYEEIWRTGATGIDAGLNQSLVAGDRNGDGRVEIQIGYLSGTLEIQGSLPIAND